MRPTWDEYFISIAQAARRRSTCSRGKVGAVIVRDRRVLSTGYNGTPAGMPHCEQLGCDVEDNEHEEGCRRTVHAEANAIAWAARAGVAIDESSIYITHSPCYECAKLIVSCGIVACYYDKEYRLSEGKAFLATAGRSVLRQSASPEPQEGARAEATAT